MSKEFLLQVNKPARYIGAEWNIPAKDFAQARIRFALCFPDLYEVGMSNLGVRIIYGLLNAIPDVTCERFFSLAQDMEEALSKNGGKIFSLESQKQLVEFDIVGFSLGSELSYTNALNIIRLGGIPLKSDSRDSSFPLVIGGGPCAINPEPLHHFFDFFLIGEAEDAVLELIDAYRDLKESYKDKKISKEDLLINLSKIQGVYAPSLYEVIYDAQNKIREFKPRVKGIPQKIKKRITVDLNSAYFPVEWLVPYIQIVHDRISLEIMRGCPNRCRFCQARSQYFPFRIRNQKNLLELAAKSYQRTGYEEISLAGLSVSDYPDIEGLSRSLADLFKDKGIAISLPSIKVRANVGGLSSQIAKVKKTGLTFAPEAGSERLRNLLAKDFSEEEFMRSLEEAYLAGYQHVKLYFMIGIPFEEDADLDAVAELLQRVSGARKKTNKGAAFVNVSINPLIPKPHTPLQWFAMENMDALQRKQKYLRAKIRNPKIKLSFHHRTMSFIEAVLSRGDRKLSRVVLLAFQKGAKFDAWEDSFVLERWLEAFQEAGIDPEDYLKARAKDEFLPWDFIDTGIAKECLLREYNLITNLQWPITNDQ